jgi:hypothetical protein
MGKKITLTRQLLIAVLFSIVLFSANAASNANVQIIHNCADPAASSVSVWADFGLGQTNISPSFAFRTATAFLPVPAGTGFTVYIKAVGSNASDPAIYSQAIPALQADSNYIAIAEGVVGSGFAANPDSVSTAFKLKLVTSARTAASNGSNVDFAIYHGSTDAPAVDIKLTGTTTYLATNAKYDDVTSYFSVSPTWYPIDVLPAGGSTPVASYVADLSSLTGGAAVVFASGFLTPSANNNGPAFGLFAALANGTVIQLPAQQKAYVQALHNVADPIADSVDVYLNGTLLLDNFAFRTATPFVPVVAGFANNLAIAPKNSTSVAEAIWQQNYTLDADSSYILTASGVVGSSFAMNPDGVNTGFQVLVKANARQQASVGTNFDFYAIHGATDAPTVDVVANGALTLINNAKYTDQTGYLSVPTASYVLAVKDSSSSVTVAQYVADLTALAGKSAVVLASGFLNPSANNNGPAFGLYVALATGGHFIALPTYTSVNDLAKEIGLSVYPNPSNGNLFINFNLTGKETVSAEIVDMNGNVVKEILNGSNLEGKQSISTDVNNLSNGIYMVRIATADKVSNTKFTVIK